MSSAAARLQNLSMQLAPAPCAAPAAGESFFEPVQQVRAVRCRVRRRLRAAVHCCAHSSALNCRTAASHSPRPPALHRARSPPPPAFTPPLTPRPALNALPPSHTHKHTNHAQAPPDPILGVTEAFLADKSPDKLNLGVGAYRCGAASAAGSGRERAAGGGQGP
jgi:hypothetical protein